MFSIVFYSGLLASLLVFGVSARSVQNEHLLATASPSSAIVTLFSSTKEPVHSLHLTFSEEVGEPVDCNANGEDLCLEWSNSAKLTVKKTPNGDQRSLHASATVPMKVCYDLKGAHLYGGPVDSTEYPNENTRLIDLPYVTGGVSGLVALKVLERYWFSSSGLNIKVHEDSPLFVSQEQDQLCLTIKNEYPYAEDVPLIFSYQSCIERRNLRDAMLCFFDRYDKPIPPETVIASPIWSTWVEYKSDISQQKVLDYYKILQSHNLRSSVIAIDDGWEKCWGSFLFDNYKFPDPKAMVDQIHSDGKLVTLWAHPFIDSSCISFNDFTPYLLKLPNSSVGLINWNGDGKAVTDLFHSKAIEWFQQRLLNLQKSFGFDAFKFVGGEAAIIMSLMNKHGLLQLQPDLFARNFVKAVSKFGTLTQVSFGSNSHQDVNGLTSIENTRSVWSAENWGLPSVLRSVLQLSVLGYGAILPDMIGGNADGIIPTKELFIRWTQLNTFLPVMQFSFTPWHFDDETIDITRTFIDLRYKYKDRILKEFKDSSHPVINPIWWISPDDSIAQTIDSEFLLGEELLVAPVLKEGAVQRDIYLPAGKWKDQNNGEVHEGPGFLRNYSAPLNVLPYFDRMSN